MTLYLLKWSFCLSVALIFYKCVLENEKMHRFNRFFLLGSLAFSLLAPLLSFEVQRESVLLTNVTPVHHVERGLANTLSQVAATSEIDYSVASLWYVAYGIVTGLLLARFGWNLFVLFHKVNRSLTVPIRGARLVLLTENTLPHTFLHYLFVNQIAYQNRAIEDELVAHELAHIRQKHSFDILLIELLTCFFWFNPVLIGYKRAIQLNHEFLADEAVTNRCQNVIHYQRLLLSKLSSDAPVLLTSTLTFQTTKQRFEMMTKQTSRAKVLISAISAVCLLIGLAITVSTRAVAQVAPGPAKPSSVSQKPETNVAEMERLYGDKFVLFPSRTPSKKAVKKKFSDLSAEEKENVVRIPPLPRLIATDALLLDWKNAKKYGIWIDDKRVPNSQLNKYGAQDFGSYFTSKLEKNAINYGKHYFQINLMTKPHYEAYLKGEAESPLLVLQNDARKVR